MPSKYKIIMEMASQIARDHPEGVDLMPADIQLSGMEVSLVNAMSRETILRQYLDTLKGQYSHILIDCQPSLGMLMMACGMRPSAVPRRTGWWVSMPPGCFPCCTTGPSTSGASCPRRWPSSSSGRPRLTPSSRCRFTRSRWSCPVSLYPGNAWRTRPPPSS